MIDLSTLETLPKCTLDFPTTLTMPQPSTPMGTTSLVLPGRLRRRNRPSRLRFDDPGYEFPMGMVPFESQVGGHAFGDREDTIGLLKSQEGRILKPIEKPLLGEREIIFYENLQKSVDPLMLELRQYIPQYYGTTDLQLKNRSVKFVILKDITEGMSKPCVMDIKIGKRTWDPLAGPAKKAAEEKKYAACKEEYAFCIPGFQVCLLSSGLLKKYDKNYGKKLNKKTVVDAMEIFLNAKPDQPPCRYLVVQLLSTLWKILALFRSQTKLRFYSSSVLLAYDAARLRENLRIESKSSECYSPCANQTLSHSNSSPSFEKYLTASPISRTSSMKLNMRPLCSPRNDGFSGQLTEHGPIFEKTVNNHSPIATPSMSPVFRRSQSLRRNKSSRIPEFSPSLSSPNLRREVHSARNSSGEKGINVSIEKLCRTHSYTNNFDTDFVRMKEDYAALLAELNTTPEERQNWVRVNMIDFAHVFPAENDSLDTNYLEGIENLIKLLEKFLVPEQPTGKKVTFCNN